MRKFFIAKKSLFCLILFFQIAIATNSYSWELDSGEVYLSILSIAHFNDDSVKDTLIGTASENRVFVPKAILWGLDTTAHDTTKPYYIPDSVVVSKTYFKFPSWINRRIVLGIDKLNYDTLSDVILFVSSKFTDSLNINHDSIMAVLILGQHGLNKFDTINISSIDTIQFSPFVALHLKYGEELTESKIRNFSGRESYILNKTDVSAFQGDSIGNAPTLVEENTKIPVVSLFPNPAITFTNLKISDISPGNYFVQLISIEGRFISEQKMKVENSNELIKTLSLDNVANGFYYLHIKSDKVDIGTFQLIVLH
ncbi:MAG: T9SS type A sorting domain-containing protein [Bacteroidetes bacterium]|nr:MAG: T9SS type A sorting domain-containing protein [Bacteroidota bacterium]